MFDPGRPVMRTLRTVILLLAFAYSIFLLCVEWQTSQEFVRHFMTDIEGPVPFYAINTTISTFLLWASALLFAVCLMCAEEANAAIKEKWFFLSQVLIFGFLGCDDRFRFHETLAGELRIGDHFVLLTIAVVEVLCLLSLGGVRVMRSRASPFLAAGCGLFLSARTGYLKRAQVNGPAHEPMA